MKKLHGITIAMVTPMDEQGAVDYASLKQLTDFLIERGVDCLYPCGTTGEMFHLSLSERKKIAETVVAQAAGRVTVYIHVGAMTYEDTVELAKHAAAIGADGIGVVTPAFFSATPAELENYYIRVANAVPKDFPVYLYNIPQCAANDLTPASVKNIVAHCDNVVGIKYSFADMMRTLEYLNVKEGFSVLHGADKLLCALLAMGCDGTVTGAGCVFPEPFVAIKKAFEAGDLAKARALQKGANELVNLMHGGANMSYFKLALKTRGIGGSHMRMPQIDLTAAEEKAYLEALGRATAALPEGLLR